MKEELKQAIELLISFKSDLKELKDYINKESQSFKIDLPTLIRNLNQYKIDLSDKRIE